MKKIKSIKQLRSEKRRLRERRAELEKAIKYDWKDLKDSFQPGKVADDFFSGGSGNKGENNGRSFFSETASQFAASLARKIAEKLQEKFGTWFRGK